MCVLSTVYTCNKNYINSLRGPTFVCSIIIWFLLERELFLVFPCACVLTSTVAYNNNKKNSVGSFALATQAFLKHTHLHIQQQFKLICLFAFLFLSTAVVGSCRMEQALSAIQIWLIIETLRFQMHFEPATCMKRELSAIQMQYK